ncbi:MAG: hypothetical protein RL114_152 [Actinomycetota bacterium]
MCKVRGADLGERKICGGAAGTRRHDTRDGRIAILQQFDVAIDNARGELCGVVGGRLDQRQTSDLSGRSTEELGQIGGR